MADVERNQMFETTNRIECKEPFMREIFKLGNQYDIYLPDIEAPAGYCHRGFKFPFLRCDLKFYTDKTRSKEILYIKQINGIDAWGEFKLFDSATNQHICTFTRKFWVLMRKWIVTNPEGQELFMIQEDNLVKSLIRRIGGKYFPPLEIILRTNMNFRTLDGATDFGSFDRKLSLSDRYDISRTNDNLDGRILWAVGPLLDSAGGR